MFVTCAHALKRTSLDCNQTKDVWQWKTSTKQHVIKWGLTEAQ